MKQVVFLFFAGGLGTICRYALSSFFNKLAGNNFPLGTLIVNIFGCFLFGLLWSTAIRNMLPDATRTIVLIGFLGSFTTFSSYIFDSFSLSLSNLSLAVANIVIQILMGFIFLYLGIKLAELIVKV